MTVRDLIVVLGCMPNESNSNSELTGRALKAAEVYFYHKTADIIASGGFTGKKGVGSEASLMRDVLLMEGVPDTSIYLEENSKTTIGNAYYTCKIVQDLKMQVEKIYLVTSCYHKTRAQFIFSKFFPESLLDTSFCLNFSRSDETEYMKLARDLYVLDRAFSLTDKKKRQSYLKQFI